MAHETRMAKIFISFCGAFTLLVSSFRNMPNSFSFFSFQGEQITFPGELFHHVVNFSSVIPPHPLFFNQPTRVIGTFLIYNNQIPLGFPNGCGLRGIPHPRGVAPGSVVSAFQAVLPS
jgi:hypothetical protein